MAPARIKFGLVLPADLHTRMQAANRIGPRGALQADYARAFAALLDALESGPPVVFAAVRGPKIRVTIRLTPELDRRLRATLRQRSLKITDFACTALTRHRPS